MPKTKSISDQIIDYIRVNRVSSTEVADCLNKTGVIENVYPVNQGKFAVGRIHWTYGIKETNWFIHKSIEKVEKDSIVVISSINCFERSLIGDLVVKFIYLYKQCRGVVVIGKVRDVPKIRKESWPVWSIGFNPVGCFNDYRDESDYSEIIEKENDYFNGSIAVCDDTGVVVINKENHNSSFLTKLENIEKKEDDWSYSINTLKKSTFETICQKKV